MPVLLSDGKELKSFDYSSIRLDPILNENSKLFFANEVKEQNGLRCLYVGQRECSTVTYDDPYIDIIGSNDSTTCHIVLIVDETNKNCSLLHFDSVETEQGLDLMINSLKKLNSNSNPSNTYSLYIVGGFNDKKKCSIGITLEIFEILINSREETFNLKLCIVTELNNVVNNDINYPIIYGLGYHIKSSKVFMCNKFENKGPDLGVRNARHFSSNGNLKIYDPINYKLVIEPFDYDIGFDVEQCLELPDTILLKFFSTSPEQEPSDFIESLRRTFQTIVAHPDPLETYFKNNKPFIYSKQENGDWKLDE